MLITRRLGAPCPNCGVSGQYGNVNVGDNILNRGCNACGKWVRIPLPEVTKQIIYLDQFFLSHAFRKQEQPFVEAAQRIRDLADRQLVVCPYSSVHTDETHLWRHDQQAELYEFIKRTARGYKFSEAYEIKQGQMHRSFDAFRTGANFAVSIDSDDALRDNVHRWDDYFWIDVGPILGDMEALREGKMDAIAELVKLFPAWASSQNSFEQDISEEARGYGRSLLQQYMNMLADFQAGNLMSHLEAPLDTMYVESLLHFDREQLEAGHRLERISEFFASPYFAKTPNIWISCGLFSMLRKLVRNGAFSNPQKARKKLGGLFFDSECISVFGPYCDAFFMDRAMHRWCEDPEAKLLAPYKTKIFSADNWDEFHSFLDAVEAHADPSIRDALAWVYPEMVQ